MSQTRGRKICILEEASAYLGEWSSILGRICRRICVFHLLLLNLLGSAMRCLATLYQSQRLSSQGDFGTLDLRALTP
ncbi:hypothetical protein EUGRSUZ_C00750 [Eucalyptus grandis]|uniref:Uncharacterized protein n=2 Tax=Eucalyptus grandis TaxID=71139 RepID=A0A059CM53_EUCGR|nr:hypothetical protein EUGRSUZ_C00750 [Eucalyptus grandis]